MFQELHFPEPGIGIVFKRDEYPVKGTVSISTWDGVPLFDADAVIAYGYTQIFCSAAESKIFALYKNGIETENGVHTVKPEDFIRGVQYKFVPDQVKSIKSVFGKARIDSDMSFNLSESIEFRLSPLYINDVLFKIEV